MEMEEEKATASPHPVLKAALEGNLRLLKELAPLVADECIWIRALCVAAMEGRLDLCAYLVEDLRVDVNQPNDLGETALFISATFGAVAAARYLLDRGADPTIPGRLGSPLHTATMNGHQQQFFLGEMQQAAQAFQTLPRFGFFKCVPKESSMKSAFDSRFGFHPAQQNEAMPVVIDKEPIQLHEHGTW